MVRPALFLLAVLLSACSTLVPEPAPPAPLPDATAALLVPSAAGTEVFPFKEVSAGSLHTCGVTQDGGVTCWGLNSNGQASPPDGTFLTVDAGNRHTCGVKQDGTVACWGSDDRGQASPPDGSFLTLSAGNKHTCGVKQDGGVACWGFNISGQASPPDGLFKSVSAGDDHTCGVKQDGSVACWGSNAFGQASPPDGSFLMVSAFNIHTCGVKGDGSVACWGSNTFGQTSSPDGSFLTVSAGSIHTCGVRGDGTVACWGDDLSGRASPPDGLFKSVSAGGIHTCGVRGDGSVACWGSNDFSQASPPTPPVITTPPSAQSLEVGEPLLLSAAATGTGMRYTWRKDGTAIGGATGSSYSVAAVSTGDAGLYDVQVTNVAGRTTSEAARVRVTRLEQTVTFTSTPPVDARVGGLYTPAATASSGLGVEFTSSGGCLVSGGTVRFVEAGSCTVRASQAGDGSYAPASAVQALEAGAPVAQTFTLDFSTAPTGRMLWSAAVGRGVSGPSHPGKVLLSAQRRGLTGNMAVSTGGAKALVIASSATSLKPYRRGGVIDLNLNAFSAGTAVGGLKVSGVTTPGGVVRLYRSGVVVRSVAIPVTGATGSAALNLDGTQVNRVRVTLTGPGAVDDLTFSAP